MRLSTSTLLSFSVACQVGFFCSSRQAFATHAYFELPAKGTWGSLTAWTPNLSSSSYYSSAVLTLPGGSTTTVPSFYIDSTSSLNVDDSVSGIDGSQTLGWSFDMSSISLNSLVFDQLYADTSPRWIVLESTGTALELGSSATLSFQLGGISSSPTYLYLISSPTIDVEGTTSGTQRTLTIGAEIWGTGFTKTGSGTLSLVGTNVYSGATIIHAGTLAISADGSLGDTSGVLYLNGGSLRSDANFSLASARSIDLYGGGYIDTNGHNLTILGGISDNGILTKTGTGNLTISGTKTGTGEIQVSNGTLVIDSNFTTGSNLTVSRVGSNGTGSLTQDGYTAIFNSAILVIGDGATDVGTYNLQNAASLTIGNGVSESDLYVGNSEKAPSTSRTHLITWSMECSI